MQLAVPSELDHLRRDMTADPSLIKLVPTPRVLGGLKAQVALLVVSGQPLSRRGMQNPQISAVLRMRRTRGLHRCSLPGVEFLLAQPGIGPSPDPGLVCSSGSR